MKVDDATSEQLRHAIIDIAKLNANYMELIVHLMPRDELKKALSREVALQAKSAELLNSARDEGRTVFKSADEWLTRLEFLLELDF